MPGSISIMIKTDYLKKEDDCTVSQIDLKLKNHSKQIPTVL